MHSMVEGPAAQPTVHTLRYAPDPSTTTPARRGPPPCAGEDFRMIVFPAIDLKASQVVRLAEGDMARATVYADDPAAQAEQFAAAGADWLHVVDLDAAFAGESINGAAVRGIVEAFGGNVQLGGGIRTRAAIERWFDAGVTRAVIGTAALTDPALVTGAARDFPNRIVVAVDARDGMIATQGWADVSDMPVLDLARRFEDAGVAEIADIHALKPHPNIEGVITGRALYDGRLDLAEAIAAARA